MAVTDDQIIEAALSRLSADTTFRTLTGATATDDRLYHRYQAEAVVSDTQPAYITYMTLPSGESRDGLLHVSLSFSVWGFPASYETVKAVKARLVVLFDQQIWTIGSDRIQSRVVRRTEIDQPDANFIGKVVQIRCATLDRRPT